MILADIFWDALSLLAIVIIAGVCLAAFCFIILIVKTFIQTLKEGDDGMNCPKCGGNVKVIDNAHTPQNEIYRRRRCSACKHIFYTLEFEVEYNDQVKKEWNEFVRTSKHKRK